MKYHFKIHKEGDGYWAQCIELPGCVTQADTQEELQKNMQEALNLYITEPASSKELADLPDETIKLSRNIVEVAVNPINAIGFLVRYFRIKHGFTQKEASRKMGFDKIYSYQRLESGRSNPSLKLLYKIKQVYPELSIDYIFNIK